MPINEQLAIRVREMLAHLPGVEEKKMFGGIAFMVNSKLCITVNKDRIMCRIDPADYDKVIKTTGVEPVKMRGQDYKGYIFVKEDTIKTKDELSHWVALALDFNTIAKASKKK